MKKLFLALCFILYLSTSVFGAHIYVEEDGGNPGQIMYDANGWPSEYAGTRTENSDIDAAIVAAGANGIVELSGSTNGITYSSTELDSADGADITTAISEFKGSLENGHNGTVTFNGSGLTDHVLYCNVAATISNINFINAPSTKFGVYLTGSNAILQDCTFNDCYGGVQIYQTASTVSRCSFSTCSNNAIKINGSDDTKSPVINYCIIKDSGENDREMIIYHGDTITFNNCLFVGNDRGVLYSGTGTQDIVLNNCIFSANLTLTALYHIVNNAGSGTCTIKNCVLLPHPARAISDDKGFYNITDGGNNVFTVPGFIQHRRPAYIAICIDDQGNFAHWCSLADACAAHGFRCTWALNDTDTFSNWSTLQTYIDAGHEVTSHTRHHVDLSSMNAFNVQYTGAAASCTMTINIASNSITITTTGGVDDLSIDISNTNYDTIGEIHAYINNQANYTSSTASTDGDSDTGLGSSLADITDQDIKTAEYTCLFDTTRYFTEEITNSKSDIESNLSGYTCNSFVFPYNSHNETAEDWVKDAEYLGSRSSSSGTYSLESMEIYNIYGNGVPQLIGTTDDTDGALTIMDIKARTAALAERLCYDGAAIVLVGHDNENYSLTNWEIILEALEESNIEVLTLSEMINKIRSEGSTVDNETWTRSFTDGSNYHLRSLSSCINTGTDVSLVQDFEKQRVPRNSIPEIGAYEYWPKPFNCISKDYKNRPFRRPTSKNTKLGEVIGN